MIRKIMILLLFIMLITVSSYAETIVFEGVPMIRNSSSPEDTINEELAGEDKVNYKLIITKEGEDYIWFSREKRKLRHFSDGYFDYFVAIDRSDYIKIGKGEDGRYLYMEHLTDGLKTITYWGVADKISL